MPYFGASIAYLSFTWISWEESSVFRLLTDGSFYFVFTKECCEEQGKCCWCTVLRQHASSFLFSWVTIRLTGCSPAGALAAQTQPLWLDGSRQDSQAYCLQCIRYSSYSRYDLAKCYFWLLTVCCQGCSTAILFISYIIIKHLFNIYFHLSVWQKKKKLLQ